MGLWNSKKQMPHSKCYLHQPIWVPTCQQARPSNSKPHPTSDSAASTTDSSSVGKPSFPTDFTMPLYKGDAGGIAKDPKKRERESERERERDIYTHTYMQMWKMKWIFIVRLSFALCRLIYAARFCFFLRINPFKKHTPPPALAPIRLQHRLAQLQRRMAPEHVVGNPVIYLRVNDLASIQGES